MNNPWKHLPQTAPFLLPEDAEKVTTFNKRCNIDNKMHTELPPEPYAGRMDAPVVLLMRRPSYHDDDAKYMVYDATFSAIMQRTRVFEEYENPFYHLNEKYPQNPGFHYWNKLLKEPIRDLGLRACSQGFLLLQLFPYKTNAGLKGKYDILPSFSFTKEILLKAMRRNSIVIQMTATQEWQQNVPELKYYKHITCNSSINLSISRHNIGIEEYDQVISAIKKNTEL